MIDKVSLYKLIDAVLQPSKERKETDEKVKDREDIKVSLSEAIRVLENRNGEEHYEKKVEEIKEKVERGEYELSEEKIKEGLKRFFL